MRPAAAEDPTSAPAHPESPAWGWALLAMALAALDLSRHLFRNMVQFDEGSLGLAASLVRHGAWPHRDFTDIYSGGLALFDAGVQGLLGDDLRALRIPFGIAAILWVGLLTACFRRFFTPRAAAGLALVAFLWGPPLYTAAMPSWYLLFLATAMLWCLFRWHETRRPSWWIGAGGCIGLALLIKINALFLLAAAGCVLLTDEQRRSGVAGLLLLAGGVAAAVYTIGSGWPWESAAPLLLPLLAMAGTAAWRERRVPGARLPDLAGVAVPAGALLLGVALFVIPWVFAYAAGGGLHALIEGVLVLPFRRPLFAGLPLPSLGVWDLLATGLLFILIFRRWEPRWAAGAAVLVVALAVIGSEAARADPEWIVPLGWRLFRSWGMAGLLAVAVAACRQEGPEARPILIAGWVATWFALLQYPFAAPNYLAYVAPLILVAAAAAARSTTPRPIGAALALALAVWTLGVDHGQPLTWLGHSHSSPPPPMERLDLPRGGLTILRSEAQMYTGVMAQLDRWGARTIVAGPDAPEVYYLSGRLFPDREFFEFMAPRWSVEVLAQRIATHRPDAVVLNEYPYFSRIPVDSVLALLPVAPIADTTIGRFRLLRLRAVDASP